LYGGIPKNLIFIVDEKGIIEKLDDHETEFSYSKINDEI
jgi:hypothetical protein